MIYKQWDDTKLEKLADWIETKMPWYPPQEVRGVELERAHAAAAHHSSARTMDFGGVRFDFRRFGDAAARARRGFARGAATSRLRLFS